MPSGQDQKLSTAELLFRQASTMGLEPSWIVPDGLFAIDTPNGERYINNTTSVLNSHVSASLSLNKPLTRVIMARHGIPNIPFTRPKTMIEARLFLENYKKIIVKPYNGSGARNIHIVESPVQLVGLPVTECILEKYIAGREMRYLVLDGEVVSVHESRYGESVQADRYLERVAYDTADWNSERIEMSLRVTKILGLRFAAVDFLVDENDRYYVLEVNSSPGLKWFHAPTSGPPVDIAAMFMQAMLPA